MVENEDRPASLPYKGAWLWVGKEMIHLMELPNPDPADGRPEHGGRDRHLCLVRLSDIASSASPPRQSIPFLMRPTAILTEQERSSLVMPNKRQVPY